jgi:two-component system, cell cycle response regulator
MKYSFIQRLLITAITCLFYSKMVLGEQVTNTSLKNLKPLGEHYMALEPARKKAWLINAIALEQDATNIYRLGRELAFLYNAQSDTIAVLKSCEQHPPKSFDLDFRLVCVLANKSNEHNKQKKLIELYSDAIEFGDTRNAAESLSVIGWIQQSNGEIEQAFRSYEAALPLAEYVDIYLLNDVSLNLALLYVMHGDIEYIDKGIALMTAAIARLNILQETEPDAVDYTTSTLAMIHYNLGVANTFHVSDYKKAIEWFSLVDRSVEDLQKSVLVFSGIAHASMGATEKAEKLLTQSYKAPVSKYFDSSYLACYQQVIKDMLALKTEMDQCESLHESTPLEVKLDLFSRMVNSKNKQLRYLGLINFYDLFDSKLKVLLKQNAAKSASRAELSRLQQESRLKGELIEKEKALTKAEQDKVATQRNFTISIMAIFALILTIVLLQLRQKQKLAQQFARMSLRDRLTGLHNRHYFEQNIQRELNFVKRAKGGDKYNPIAIYLFDIDHFKKINDNFGHDIGDSVLKEFSARISESIRESDMLIRWGGEEFILVAKLFENGDYHQIAERIRSTIYQSDFELENDITLKVSCTVGGIIYPNTQDNMLEMSCDQLIKLADNALYLGKRKSRNCWVCIDAIKKPEELDNILQKELSVCAKEGMVKLSDSL